MINSYLKKIKLVVPKGLDPPRIFHLLRNIDNIKKLILVNKISKYFSNWNNCIYAIQIKFLENLTDKTYIRDAITKMVGINKRSRLLVDLSAEAITFNGYTSDALEKFHTILNDINVFKGKNIYLLNANSKSEHAYNSWLSLNNINSLEINMIGYDFYLFEYYSELKNSFWYKNYANKKILQIVNSLTDTSPLRNNTFSTFNLRPRPHRWALILYLRSKNLISNGLVTFFGEEFGFNDTPSVSEADEIIRFIQNVETTEGELLQYYDEIMQSTPIINERNSCEIRSDLWARKEGEIQFLIPEADRNGNINDIESYYEIVTETWLTNSDCMYITEKTLRAILRMQIFIIIGSPFTIRHLNDMGFKSFSPYINESYDEIEDPILRLRAIFIEIERIEMMGKTELHKLYVSLIPIFIHNLNHLLFETPNILNKAIKDMKIFK